MTKIEDMSEPERQSWITFLADGAVFIYFWQKMTQGYGFQAQHFEPEQVGRIFFGVVFLTIILHTVISLIFEARKRKERYEKDERDLDITRRGDRNGYWLLQAGIGVIIVTYLFQYLIGSDYKPPISVKDPIDMLFALMVVSYIASLVKHGTMLLAYRRG